MMQAVPMRPSSRAFIILASLTSTGCIDLDQPDQIKDLRILALKLEPPEIVYSPFHLTPPNQRGGVPLGPYATTAQVLAIDPQGREIDLSWRLCPENRPLDGCAGYRIRDTAPAEEVAAISGLVTPQFFTRQADLSLGGEL